MTILYLLFYFVPFLFLFFTGIEILLRDPRNQLHRLTMGFILFCSLLFLGDFFGQMLPPSEALAGFKIKLASAFLVMSIGLHFFRALTRPSRQRQAAFHVLALLPIAGCIPLLIPLPGFEYGLLPGRYGRTESYSPAFQYVVYALALYSMLGFIFLTHKAYRKSRSNEFSLQERRRTQVILKGIVVCSVWLIIAEGLLKPLLAEIPMVPLSAMDSFSVVIFAFFIRHAMVNYGFLSTASRKYQLLFDLSGHGIFLLNHLGRLEEMNPAAARMLGFQERDKSWKGRLLEDLVTLADAQQCETFRESIRKRAPLELESRIRNRWGQEFVVVSKMDYIEVEGHYWRFLTYTDITQNKENERKLLELAYQDSLTGLLNRRRFMEILAVKVESRPIFGQPFAVFILDLDRFKWVNDTLGHAAGDELLQAVAIRLTSSLPERAHIARIGGDEFVVLLENVLDEAEVRKAADTAAAALNEPVNLHGTTYEITASAGIRIAFEEQPDMETILRDADSAMYDAKQSGRNRYRIFGRP